MKFLRVVNPVAARPKYRFVVASLYIHVWPYIETLEYHATKRSLSQNDVLLILWSPWGHCGSHTLTRIAQPHLKQFTVPVALATGTPLGIYTVLLLPQL